MKISLSKYIIFPLLIYSVYWSSLMATKGLFRDSSDANATQVPNPKPRLNNLSPKQNSLENSSLTVTAGSGWITRSDYPDVVPPGYGLNVSDGGYDSQSNRVLLNIKDRYVEILLSEPLRDEKTIQFTVIKIINYESENLFSRFIIPGLIIRRIVRSDGQLRKDGNEIHGRFAVEGMLIPPKERDGSRITGSVSGSFLLRTTARSSSIFQLPLEEEGRFLGPGDT